MGFAKRITLNTVINRTTTKNTTRIHEDVELVSYTKRNRNDRDAAVTVSYMLASSVASKSKLYYLKTIYFKIFN
jgi:hypothetical protein